MQTIDHESQTTEGTSVNDTEHRRHFRLKHRAKIRLTVPVGSKSVVLVMRDFSESGLFLLCPDQEIPPIGAVVEVQTMEFEDAPVQPAKVVRVEAGIGFGLEFMV